MVRRTISRRQALGRGLQLLAAGGPLVLLAAACQQAPAPAKPAESSKPAEAAKPTQQAPAQAASGAAKPTEAAKPAAAAAAPAAAPTAQPATQAATQAAGAPKRGGTLRVVAQNDFVTMFPAVTTGPTANQVFDWLVMWRKGANGRWGPKPGLAESWDLSDKAAVFKLRKGIKFHDGSDLNAEVVRWNVETWIKNPKSLAKTDLPGVDADNPAEVVDDSTVKINLKGPFGSILSAVSDGTRTTAIISKAAYDKLGEDGIRLQAVGTGPFTFGEWQSGSQLILNKNPNYWDKGADGQPLPYVDKIHYRFVPDDSVRLVELRSGNADFTELVRGRDVPSVKSDQSLVYVEDPGNGNRYRFFFNGQQGPFKDNVKLRQAVQYAIDREAVAKALGGGVGVAQKYDLLPGTLGYDESIPFYGFDLDKAKALMKESGVSTPLPIRLTVITREADQQQAQLLQAMLDKIGIQVNIEALERVAWGQKVRQQNDFDMGTQRTSGAIDPDPLFTLSWAETGPAAYIRAKEPEIQAAIAEGRASYDEEKRQAIYVRCQKLMHESAWWGYIWLQPWNYVFSKKVQNVPPMYADYWREEQMWLS
ncbi:MAG: ABC transporter substrate-binding protein [Chloroflexi bacterium]|nr:ABC transporter substrate-binding protein [Chloroflexota bacterium]